MRIDSDRSAIVAVRWQQPDDPPSAVIYPHKTSQPQSLVKLHIDFAGNSWRVRHMASSFPDEIDAAVTTLLLVAGELMENASADAASLLPADPRARRAITDRLSSAGRDIAVLTAAAHRLASLPKSLEPTTNDN